MQIVNSLPVDSWTKVLSGLTVPSATSSSTSSLVNDFAKLLASQTRLGADGLDMLGASDSSDGSSSNDTFSALMAPASSGLGQMEALLTLRLIDALDRLVSRQTAPATQNPSGLPVAGPISQDYHPGHSGIDIAVPSGTPVRATMSGKVAYAGWNTEGYGNLVIVENGPYRTYYAHLERIPVTVGQAVEAGNVVGLSGSTGHSTGPHVHYEVRIDGNPVSPTAVAPTAQA